MLGVGDSHVQVFEEIRRLGLRSDASLEVCFVDGASALGIANARSSTAAIATFSARLDRARVWQRLYFQLGEVDRGSAIWKRAARHEEPVSAQLVRSISNYATFLGGLADRGLTDISVISVPLPTVRDYWANAAQVAARRADVTASLEDRTALTLEYNALLSRHCETVGFPFIDVTPELLDASTGLIDRRAPRPWRPSPSPGRLRRAAGTEVVSGERSRRRSTAGPLGDLRQPAQRCWKRSPTFAKYCG